MTFTCLALRQNQSDVQRHGWLFSMVVIYGMNLFVLAVTMALVSPHVKAAGLAGQFGDHCAGCWQWVDHEARALYALCENAVRRAN